MFVKICGVTNEEDALLAVALGADAVGLNFVPGSPRQVTVNEARDIVRRLPPEALTVGVFRDERPERVAEVVNGLGLGGAQLHGREPQSEARWIRVRVPFLIQGFRAGDPAIGASAGGPADVVLLDGESPGSGELFDWALAEGAPVGTRLLLAGGLTPDNVGAAIRRVRPWGVDVATGVETEPGSGRKDARKLARFLEEAREAGAEMESDGWVPADAEPYDWEVDEVRSEQSPP
ncbi:MAG TPA: phosphoribosylanthranilate isomerase [Acidimicrobiia bacterium]|nr:phosphoribosylanthranilate isomerase [Acidimicrobiia bacterium]